MPPPRPAGRRSGRGGAAGPLIFAVVVLAVGATTIVLGRPAVVSTVTDIAEDRPGLLRNTVVRDFVRSGVGEDALARPLDPKAQTATFVVERGETAADVARRLAEQGIVQRPIVFLLAVYASGKEDSLQAGTYRISAAMAPIELADVFQRAFGEQLVLRVIEGWRLSEIAAEVEKRFPRINAATFLAAAKAGPYRFDFLNGVREGTPLEGFLYPDTYFFATDVGPEEIVRTLLDAFQRRAGAIVTAGAQRRNVSQYDVVIIASIVEREARARKESPTIASVFWNRMDREMALDADPTVQYAIGAWRELTLEDLKVDSPYNTYRHPGLPPTPICAPGQAALEGAAEPLRTDFLFFVAKSDGTGEHAFAKTLEEHEANRVKYGNR